MAGFKPFGRSLL